METNFKMVAILKIETHRFSKGTFRSSPPKCTLTIDSIRQAVLLEIDGNLLDGQTDGQTSPLTTIPLLGRGVKKTIFFWIFEEVIQDSSGRAITSPMTKEKCVFMQTFA
jgi:hypothetical protein